MTPRTLEATYRARAIPTGSARHFSWLFAAPAVRAPLLGVYALQAEWNALLDPRTERSAAQLKLSWWQEEMRRLTGAAPVHPISLYLASLSGAPREVFAPLIAAIDAAAAEVGGAPLERAADLAAHACALRGNPLLVAAAVSGTDTAQNRLHDCIGALAAAEHVSRSIEDYGRDARAGRVAFAVDELLAAEIDNAMLAAPLPDPRLAAYLERLRERAAQLYAHASVTLPRGEHAPQRHLLVLATLGAERLRRTTLPGLRALVLAWTTARRAALTGDFDDSE